MQAGRANRLRQPAADTGQARLRLARRPESGSGPGRFRAPSDAGPRRALQLGPWPATDCLPVAQVRALSAHPPSRARPVLLREGEPGQTAEEKPESHGPAWGRKAEHPETLPGRWPGRPALASKRPQKRAFPAKPLGRGRCRVQRRAVPAPRTSAPRTSPTDCDLPRIPTSDRVSSPRGPAQFPLAGLPRGRPVRGTVPGCPQESCKTPTPVFPGDPPGALLTAGPRVALGRPSDEQDGQRAPSPTCKYSRR